MTEKPIPERLRAVPPAVAAFLMEIDAVCLKHGLVLEVKYNKWTPPNLEVHHYNRTARNLLLAAQNTTIGDAKPNQVEESRDTVVWEGKSLDFEEKFVAIYKDYYLRLVTHCDGPGVDGFINGRLMCKNGEIEAIKQELLNIVDLRDPTDHPTTKG